MKSRRTILRTVGLAGVAGLAGCTGEDTTDEAPGTDADPAEETTGTAADRTETSTTDETSASGNWRAVDADARNTSANTRSAGPTSGASAETLYEAERLVEFLSPPLVEDGQTFVLDGQDLSSVSSDGEQTWQYSTGGFFSGSDPMPAVRDGTVYVPVDSTLVAVTDGERDWAEDFENNVEHDPVPTEDAVYVTTRESLVALSHDGSKKWTQTLDQTGGRFAVADSTLYQFVTEPFSEPTIKARDVSDGTSKWSLTDSFNESALVVADGTLYTTRTVDSGVKLLAVSVADGSVEWEAGPIGDGTEDAIVEDTGSVAVANGTAYLLAGNKLQAYDTDSESARWSSPYVTTGTAAEAPRVDSNSVYLFYGNAVIAVDRSTGDQRWSTAIGDGAYTDLKGLVPADDSIYVTTADEILTIS